MRREVVLNIKLMLSFENSQPMERIFYRQVLRYSNPRFFCFSFSLSLKGVESLNCPNLPNTCVHWDSVHQKPYFCPTSSGLSLFCYSGSQPTGEKPSLLKNYPFRLYSSCGFDSNLHHKKSCFSNSSSGIPSSFQISNPSSLSFNTLTFDNIHRFDNRRLLCVSSSNVSSHRKVGFGIDAGRRKREGKRSGVVDLAPEVKSSIIEIIIRDEDDMEAKLSSIVSVLSLEFITHIFQVLNSRKTSALRFFRWARANSPRLYSSANFCSLIISNCGWLDDYDTMLSLLNEFKSESICLHESAFWFLSVFRSSQSSLLNSVGRIMELLDMVGGSCRNSGICALIEMFCRWDLFNIAKHVMEISGKKSYYDILVRERCKKRHLASDIIQEMIEFGCEPTIKTYNYLVGSLCKQDKMTEAHEILELMQKKGVFPDASTYEIFVHKFCNCGKVDNAKDFLNKMENIKLQPRVETHTAFLRALFKAEQFVEAHNYVIDSSAMYKCTSSKLYSLLADLHQRSGDLRSSQGILVEMMEKGHKPDFTVYIALVKKLQKIGQDDLAKNLQCMFSRFLGELTSNTE